MSSQEKIKLPEIVPSAEARLLRVVQNMPVLMDAFDEKGQIVAWNRECERVTGYLAEEVIGNPDIMRQLCPDPDEIKPIMYLMGELKSKAKSDHYLSQARDYRELEWDLRCKDGSIRRIAWSNVSASVPITGWASWGIGIDVTEKSQARAQLEVAYQKTREEVETRDQFLSVASHELKTPITSMQLQLQMLKKIVPAVETGSELTAPATRWERSFQCLERGMARLTRLLDEMLDISRIRSEKFKLHCADADLVPMIRGVVDRFSPDFVSARMDVSVAMPSKLVIRADVFWIEQVITNLVSNAIRYAPNGPLHIEARCPEEHPCGLASIIVRDSGPGIAKEDQGVIFERFERLSQPQSLRGRDGLGLGLFIVKEIVQAHHGQVRIDSEIGRGSAFVVELPAS